MSEFQHQFVCLRAFVQIVQDNTEVHYSGFRTPHIHNLSDLVLQNLGVQVCCNFSSMLVLIHNLIFCTGTEHLYSLCLEFFVYMYECFRLECIVACSLLTVLMIPQTF